MKILPLLASGDPVLFMMLAGILLLAGTSIGLGCAGIFLAFGKAAEKRKTGRRFMMLAAVPVVAAAVWWVAVVGFD